uniref:Uncharacterized protein n=1 Tax=Nitophyllum punctatum TaxID=158729 RepID=A0A4D6WW64_9FLOR|nr:hypothetical protein [Nitophyllum punctatum]
MLVHIHSPKILIPKDSIIEINQSGLFNDTFIDIIPTQKLGIDISSMDYDKESVDVFANSCLESQFLCNYHYLQGDRGLNYDDLIRATTRISQRFDDPRFFCLFYLFLQNSINISDEILYSLYDISLIVNIFIKFVRTNFSSYLF